LCTSEQFNKVFIYARTKALRRKRPTATLATIRPSLLFDPDDGLFNEPAPVLTPRQLPRYLPVLTVYVGNIGRPVEILIVLSHDILQRIHPKPPLGVHS
jgi:hypothetical protein